MGQGLAPVKDDYSVKEVVAPVKAKKVSKCRHKTIPTENKELSKPWIIKEEVALCQVWCDMSENRITKSIMKSMGFWLKVTEYFEKETGNESGSCDLTVYQKACVKYAIKYDHDFSLEPCWQILKNHSIWKEVEMPSFYSKQNPGSKKTKTSKTTSGSMQSGLNLNEEADGHEEEFLEVVMMVVMVVVVVVVFVIMKRIVVDVVETIIELVVVEENIIRMLIINDDSPVPEPPVVAIPDEYLLKFHSIKDVKSLWEASKISQSNTPQLDNKDLEQIDTDDLEEMDLKWQVAMITMRGNRSTNNERRVVPVETPASALVVQDGLGGYDWSYQAKEGPTDFALMAHSSDSANLSNSEVQSCSNECLQSFKNIQKQYDQQKEILNRANLEILGYQYGLESLEERIYVHYKNETVFEESIAFLKYDVQVRDISIKDLKNQLEETMKEKDDLKEKLTKFEESSKNLTKLINSQMSANDKTSLGYDSQLSDNEMHKCEIFEIASDSSVSEIDEDNNQAKDSVNHLIKDCTFFENKMVEKYVVNNKGKGTGQREVRLVWNNARRVNHQNFTKMTHLHPKRNCVPTAVATKSGQVLVNAAKQNAAASTSTARPKGKNVLTAGPKAIVNAAEGKKENVVKSSACWIWRPKGNLIDHTSKDSGSYTLKRFNYVDPNGRLKSAMTWNVVSSGDLTYLFAKATIDESSLWHKRLGHINFKTLNKLVRGNLVRDHLGKFDGKADEGFLVGYSVNSKAFRVFNSRTREVKENMHVNFLENKSNVTGNGPEWLFNIDSLTKSMNYESVSAGNQSNGNAGDVNAGDQPGDVNPDDIQGDVEEISRNDDVCQGNKIRIDNSTHVVNCSSTIINTASNIIAVGSLNINTADSNHTNMPTLEATGIFNGAFDDRDLGAEADTNNLDSSTVETAMVSFINRQRRTNHKDFQNCLFACFLSQMEPKKVIQALKDPSWIEPCKKSFFNSSFRMYGLWWIYFIEKELLAQNRFSETSWMKEVIQALKDPSWMEAMQEELLQFKLQDRYSNQKQSKASSSGAYKEEGIDYDEIFAPVARIEAIRLFLAHASFKDFILYQMDVKSLFLYRKIKEEVYVCQPPRFEDPDFPDKVYKVKKALYGLHQALRAWYETLSTYLLNNRFKKGHIDKTLFIKRNKGDILLVQVYVDDIIFGSTKKEICDAFEILMHEKFQMSSMGELTFFLGLQVKQKQDGIFISQDKYVAKILKKFGFSEVKTANTSMETSKPLLKDEDGQETLGFTKSLPFACSKEDL
nr:hypothetical protein [Tanacetum cinerariifolium]